MTTMTKKALVLAAGQGTRLNGDCPKPAFPILGLPLLARTLLRLEEAGIEEAYVVVGYGADRVREAISRVPQIGLDLHWIENPAWERENGLSVLAAREALRTPFILAMADHLFDPEIVRRLRSARVPEAGIALAVDQDIERVPDLEDATRVLVEGDRIVDIGKSLDRFNAVDTGLFLATPGLFGALEEAASEGAYSLSAGIRRLGKRGLARAERIGDAGWLDIDTPAAVREAERRLMNGLGKPSDGFVARAINRPLSKAITRRLVRTPVTPNQVSFFNLGIGVVAGLAAAVGGYLGFLAAAVLFQFASVLDGTDGELAHLKHLASRRGQWIDTITDGLTYVAFIGGLSVGVARSSLPDAFWILGAAGFVPLVAALLALYAHLLRNGDSGSLVRLQSDLDRGRGPVHRLAERAWPLLKRDLFSLFFVALALVGLLHLALPLFLVAACGLLAFAVSLHLQSERWTSRAWISPSPPRDG